MNIADYGLSIEPLNHDEIMEAVKDEDWQVYRLSMKGLTTHFKLSALANWLERGKTPDSDKRRIQVMNYLNALKRGGQLDKDGNVVR